MECERVLGNRPLLKTQAKVINDPDGTFTALTHGVYKNPTPIKRGSPENDGDKGGKKKRGGGGGNKKLQISEKNAIQRRTRSEVAIFSASGWRTMNQEMESN